MTTVREGSPFVSHGRGGAANVTRDDQPYADGGIVREGPAGGPGSTGRGGQGNVGSPRVDATKVTGNAVPASNLNNSTGADGSDSANGARSADYVPEVNVKQAPENYHIGRGGEGNAQYHGAESRSNSNGGGSSIDGKPVHVHEGAAQRFKEMLLGQEGKP